MTTFPDGVRVGATWWGTYPNPSGAGEREDAGVPLFPIQLVQFPTASTTATNNIVSGFTATAASIAITATGALVSGGVATLDYARCLQYSATSDLSFGQVVAIGTDWYGQTLKSSTAGPNNAVVKTLSAFKTVSSLAWSATAVMPSALAVGNSDTFGLPYVLANTGNGFGQYVDGSTPLSVSTWTAGLATTVTPTATTADVRGTVALATSALPNGTRNISLQMNVVPGSATTGAPGNSINKVQTYGQTPFAG